MDALLRALGELRTATDRAKCPFARLIETLPEEIQQLILNLAKNTEISHRAIHNALRKAGANIARETVSDHRNGRCICTTKGQS